VAIIRHTGSHTSIFILAGTMYLIALIVIRGLSPRPALA
jgi:hypothetical protein